MPIYLTGGEGHDLFRRYEPQIVPTVKGTCSCFDSRDAGTLIPQEQHNSPKPKRLLAAL
jgi:hypothetical protein